jgi:preprotein translocase subunit SecG
MILENLLLAVHVLVAVALVGFVLMQHGKGADMGAAFGSGASGSLFGASGAANFLSRTTAILATLFFMTSLGLTYYASTHGTPKELMKESVTQTLPAAKDSKAADVPQGASPPAPAAAPADAPAGKSDSKAGEVPK